MPEITVLFKTRSDGAYHRYYACKCNDCNESFEVRSDRLKKIRHKCKPAPKETKPLNPKIIKEVKYKSRVIVNAHVRTMKLIAKNKGEMERLLSELKQTYVIIK